VSEAGWIFFFCVRGALRVGFFFSISRAAGALTDASTRTTNPAQIFSTESLFGGSSSASTAGAGAGATAAPSSLAPRPASSVVPSSGAPAPAAAPPTTTAAVAPPSSSNTAAVFAARIAAAGRPAPKAVTSAPKPRAASPARKAASPQKAAAAGATKKAKTAVRPPSAYNLFVKGPEASAAVARAGGPVGSGSTGAARAAFQVAARARAAAWKAAPPAVHAKDDAAASAAKAAAAAARGPPKPKAPPSSYARFVAANFKSAAAKLPPGASVAQVGKQLGAQWRAMTPSAKAAYAPRV
jgi:hypothetical protein